ncbi:hypothetical protein BDR26DRAFT_862346 [Obelidium mucronatum]|nr:hypothetical protein BDR26DRAFT_862346 [Obelidium mucronatum]
MELTRRLDKAQRLLIQKEAERMAIESMADFMRERSTETQREMDNIRSILAKITPQGDLVGESSSSISISRHHASSNGSPAPPHAQQQQQQHRDHHHHHHHSQSHHQQQPQQQQQQSHPQDSVSSIPCVEFNKHNCSTPNCPRGPHTCLYCRSSSHIFLNCDQKGCICVYYNKNECDISKCSRINICLFCLGDHPINKCPEISEDARNDMKDICNNWNAMSFCQTDQCRRTHRCLRCQDKHTTFECPLNVISFHSNPTINRIYGLFKSKVIVVRHEPYNSRYSSNGGPVQSLPPTSSSSLARDSGGKSSSVSRYSSSRDDDPPRWERRDHPDEYRSKRVRDEDMGGSGSSWRATDDRYDERSLGGESKRSRNEDENRREVPSSSSGGGGGGRYSKRRDDDGGKPESPAGGVRRSDRSNERGSVASYEEDERRQYRDRGAVSGQPPGPAPGERMNPCFAFNEKGSCPHGHKCWYRHACIKCDSFSHGEFECPKR